MAHEEKAQLGRRGMRGHVSLSTFLTHKIRPRHQHLSMFRRRTSIEIQSKHLIACILDLHNQLMVCGFPCRCPVQ